MESDSRKPVRKEIPDLQTQLEGIFDAVWNAEAEWRFDDRINLSLSLQQKNSQPPQAA